MSQEQKTSRSEDNRNRPTHRATSGKRRPTVFLIGILVVSVLLTLLAQLPHLVDRYQVEKDVQNFYAMARYQDPDLFPVDHLRGGQMAAELQVFGHPMVISPQSLGYGLLFWLGSFVIDFVWMAKLLGFFLMAISVAYLFRLGESIGDEFTGASLSLLFVFIILASPRSTAITTGVQRAFAVPLLIVFTYYLHEERYWLAAAMVFVSLLFYYPNFLIAGLTYMLAMVEVKRPLRVRLDLSQSKVIPLLLVGALSLGVVALTVATTPSRVLPKDVPVSQDAQYQPGGATPLLTGFPWMGRAGVFDSGEILLSFLTLATIGVVIFARLKSTSLQQMPPVFAHLLVASAILYAASLFVFVVLSSSALYLPSRYTRSTLIWVALGFVGVNLMKLLEGMRPWLLRVVTFFIVSLTAALTVSLALLSIQRTDPMQIRGVGVILGGPLVVLSIGAWLSTARSLPRRHKETGRALSSWLALILIPAVSAPMASLYVDTLAAETINPSPAERDMYSFLATLPKDAMIAGDPHVMVGVPLFSQRSVLFRELFPQPDAPIVEFFDAYYAESPQVVLVFCRRHEVDYLVIDRTDFGPDYLAEKAFFYKPHNDAIVDLVGERSDFLAPKLEPMFTSGSLAVIRCDADTLLGDQ